MGKIITFTIIVFLLIGGFMIYESLDTNFDDSGDRTNFLKELGKWIFQIGKSTKNTVGYAIDQDWLPKTNETNFSKIEVD
jgi:hypothetical protein